MTLTPVVAAGFFYSGAALACAAAAGFFC